MFEKLDNFRDFGGCSAGEGQVASGRLFRSAHHAELSDRDVEVLHGLGVTVVVDLRQPSERRRQPSRRHAAFCGAVVETDIEIAAGDPWISFLRTAPELSAEAFRDYIRRFYRAAPFQPGHVDVFSRYFAALAQTDGAVLVHCMAGKDRTGILVGLTHRLLGVPDEVIFRDYLSSNCPAALPGRLAGLQGFVAEHAGREVAAECGRVALVAEAEFLALAFAEIERRHGSIDGYFDAVLGVGADARSAIRRRLIVEA